MLQHARTFSMVSSQHSSTISKLCKNEEVPARLDRSIHRVCIPYLAWGAAAHTIHLSLDPRPSLLLEIPPAFNSNKYCFIDVDFGKSHNLCAPLNLSYISEQFCKLHAAFVTFHGCIEDQQWWNSVVTVSPCVFRQGIQSIHWFLSKQSACRLHLQWWYKALLDVVESQGAWVCYCSISSLIINQKTQRGQQEAHEEEAEQNDRAVKEERKENNGKKEMRHLQTTAPMVGPKTLKI